MEAFVAFMTFGCVIVGSFGLFGGVIFWTVKRAKWSRDRLLTIGEALGLASEGTRRVAGLRNGVHVMVSHVTEGSGDNRSSWTYTQAQIDSPLRLGLNLRRKGWLGAAFSELFGSSDVPTGDARFDAAFTVNAIEREEVGRLFAPELKAALMSAHGSTQRLWVNDGTVHASFSGFSTDQAKITRYLDTVIGLAQGLAWARKKMGPTAREREVHTSWRAVASASAWHFDDESLTLEGRSGRHGFTVVPTLDKSGWSTRFRVAFDRPLGAALVMQKEFTLAKVGRLFGLTDIEVGDPSFDDTFRVKGSDPNRIRHILGDATLRQTLLHLMAAARKLEVHDDCVDAVAAGLITDASALAQSLARVVDVAEGLRARVDAPRVGAYR